MGRTGTSRAILLSTGLTGVGLVVQFVLRAVLTARFGASAPYELFLYAMMPATLVAQVAFQAFASALLPRISDLEKSGQTRGAMGLFRRGLWTSLALTSTMGLLVPVAAWLAAPAHLAADPAQFLVLLAVYTGWGVLGGVLVLQRQLLIYLDDFAMAAVLGLVQPFVLLGLLLAVADVGVLAFAVTGVVAMLGACVLMAGRIARRWRAGEDEPAAAMTPLLPIVAATAPIFLASLNAQAMHLIDQWMAAWWVPNGLVLLSLALAVARLPHTVADQAMMAVGYRPLLRAVETGDTVLGEEARGAFRRLVGLQAMVVFPAMLVILAAAEPSIRVLFERGAFLREDSANTAAILRLFPLVSLGVMIQVAQVQMLVVLGRARLALEAEVVLTGLSVLLNLAFLPVMGLPGLILSTGLAQSLVVVWIAGRLMRFGVRLGDFLWPLAVPAAGLVVLLPMALGVVSLMGSASPLAVVAAVVGIAAAFFAVLAARMSGARFRVPAPAAPAPVLSE